METPAFHISSPLTKLRFYRELFNDMIYPPLPVKKKKKFAPFIITILGVR